MKGNNYNKIILSLEYIDLLWYIYNKKGVINMEFMKKVTEISKIVGKTATDTYNTVADKSGKLITDAKLKISISDMEADIERIYEDIGRTVY